MKSEYFEVLAKVQEYHRYKFLKRVSRQEGIVTSWTSKKEKINKDIQTMSSGLMSMDTRNLPWTYKNRSKTKKQYLCLLTLYFALIAKDCNVKKVNKYEL